MEILGGLNKEGILQFDYDPSAGMLNVCKYQINDSKCPTANCTTCITNLFNKECLDYTVFSIPTSAMETFEDILLSRQARLTLGKPSK